MVVGEAEDHVESKDPYSLPDCRREKFSTKKKKREGKFPSPIHL